MELTPEQQEQQKDIEARFELFKNDYIELTKKHEVDFMCFPQYVQISAGVFSTTANMQLVDRKYQPKAVKADSIIQYL